ncbi:MAG TPA: hypothetical protein PLT82_11725 [Candidatus Hydrogenedens sp.]|nr:hypothetical protein [Candidatus Hydrogenedens sp.]HOK09282.1 hypothetical protein [Candidatus Hydrogenedens sp.]HOL19868.1 hypothetical protein [Candidatus Hydrogenedens sp.]HPP59791.1 hypothetical protein [Candidatus Hydrogenedens sp.]
MHQEDRPIHFSIELIHNPTPINKEQLQRLYYDLVGTSVSYDSIDFSFPMQTRFYSTRGNRSQSIVLFLIDRTLIIEEWASITFDEFLNKVKELSPRILSARNQPVFLAHTGTLRSTYALTRYEDSKILILEKLLNQKQELIIDHFGRPTTAVGVKLIFPESNDTPGIYHVLIESFRHSKKELFVEVRGIFGRTIVTNQNIHLILENLQDMREFLVKRIQPFLSQFD